MSRLVLGALVALMVVSSVAHLWALHRDLPVYDPDEAAFVEPAVHVAATGDPNPHWFGHPGSTVIYPLAGFFHVWGALAHQGPLLGSDPVLTARLHRSPTPFYVIGRLWTIAMAVGALPLLFLVGRRAFNTRVALIATALWAVLPYSVYHGQIVRTDSAAVFFGLLALWWCLRLLDEPGVRWCVLAGVSVGLAVSSRYFMVALIPVLVAAAVLPHLPMVGGRARPIRPALRSAAIALGSAIGGFVISTPYFFFDWNTTLDSLRVENTAPGSSSGGLSHLGNLRWYLGTAIPDSLTWPLVALAAAGVVLVAWTPRVPQLLLVAFCATFLAGICVSQVHQQQWVIQILPMLLLFAAFTVDTIVHTLAAPTTRVLRTSILVPVVLVGITGALAIHPAATLVDADANPSTGSVARDWIVAHIRPGSRIIEDSIHVPLHQAHLHVDYRLDPNARTYRYLTIGSQPIRLDPHTHSLAYYQRAGYQYLIVNGYWTDYFATSAVGAGHPEAGFYRAVTCHARLVAGFGPRQKTRHGWPIAIYRLTQPPTGESRSSCKQQTLG